MQQRRIICDGPSPQGIDAGGAEVGSVRQDSACSLGAGGGVWKSEGYGKELRGIAAGGP